MRFVGWGLRAVVFVLLLVLAARNSATVSIEFFFDKVWAVPLNLVMLAFFALGAAIGVTVAVATLARQRRDILRLKREAALADSELATLGRDEARRR